MLDKIQNRLWQDQQPVTARWVCYEYICQMAGAQEVLTECKDANKGKVVITWLVEGTPLFCAVLICFSDAATGLLAVQQAGLYKVRDRE